MNRSIPTVKEMMGRLIATPSVSSTIAEHDQSNQGVVDLLAGWLSGLGFRTTVTPLPGKLDKANLVAVLGEGKGGLVLSGHTDTVPFDDDLWRRDPFTLVEDGGRYFGLGTSDMKSFFALAIEAVHGLRATDLRAPVILLATADEESTMAGARALSAGALMGAECVLIGEPTGLKPICQHKGMMILRICLTGTSGHSSNQALGNSALDATPLVINRLIDYRESLQRRFADSNFEVHFPTLNLGCIHGGTSPNRICDRVELQCDVRVLPGMDALEVFGEIRDTVTDALGATGLEVDVSLVVEPIPPFRAMADSKLLAATAALSGAPLGAVAFATEAPFFQQLGLDTVVLGPGSIEQAHRPNEYIETAQLEPAIAIIQRLVDRYCLRAPT